MTDRELIEAAAKAAGWSGWRSKHGYWNLHAPDGKAHTCCTNWASYSATDGSKPAEPTFADALAEAGWTPLDDDGDALRLAVALRIDIRLFGLQGTAGRPHDPFASAMIDREGLCRSEPVNGDPAAATRRAITRAAAALAGTAPGATGEKL